jgi:hypothetical protein
MSDPTITPLAPPTEVATPAVAVPVVAATLPVVVAPVVPPAAPVVAAPRVLNPYASPKVATPPADPRFAALEASAAASSAALGRHAASVLAEAPEGLRNAVRAIAGDDPVRQLDTLAAMRAHGLGGSVAVLPVGASTAVPAQQPAPATPVNPDAAALARYEDLQSRGAHMMAAAHLSAQGAAIARAKASRPS